MKTFIWNSEYVVYSAMANEEENARMMIIHEFIKNKIDSLIDESDKTKIGMAEVPVYVYNRARGIIRNDFFDIIQALNRKADVIIEENTSKIFDHVNE